MSNKILINGQNVDLDDVRRLRQRFFHALLIPPGWRGTKSDCVRLFIATQDMLSFDFRRLLAHNWKDIVEIALRQQARGVDQGARVSVSVSFELDHTAPTVAAITKMQLGFSEKFMTKVKPRTRDLAQDELPLEDQGVVIDAGIAQEQAADQKKEDAENAAKEKEKADHDKKKADAEFKAKEAKRKRDARAAKKASKSGATK